MDLTTIIGAVIGLVLIVLPEPVTTATGTMVGLAVLTGSLGFTGVL